MNTAYAQQASPPPHDMHRGSLPTASADIVYRGAAVPGAPQYPTSHAMSLPQQSQISPTYTDPYNSLAVTRAPTQDQQHAVDGLAPLVPGSQPTAPDPVPRSCIENGRKYELCVVQQPRRARMCGFGDKDRRPITPPPCVRIIITDIATGKEVDVNEIEHGMYVLNVDLWSADGTREVNLVRHSATSPSISSTTPVSYGQVHENPTPAFSNILPGGHANAIRDVQRDQTSQQFKYEPGSGQPYPNQAYNPYPGPPQVNPYAQPPQGQGPSYSAPQYHAGYAPPTNGTQSYSPQNGYQSAAPVYYSPGAQIHTQAPNGQGDYKQEYASPNQPASSHASLASYGSRPFTPGDLGIHRMPISSTQPTGMFTRNLIGSLAASAFRLTDPDDRIGIWFVLQDLSVRTEGNFRLRLSFVNVGAPSPSSPNGQVVQQNQSSVVNTGKAPVLAACFSDVFTVYSAKKFPGVVESTHLSKCFATQGIKIPIRKDGPSRKDGREEYDED